MAEIHVVHATSPGCHWSWGYEAVVNRLRMVYGDQVHVHLLIASPYESWPEWLEQYGMTEDEAIQWVNDDIGDRMGVPIAKLTKANIAPSMLPAAHAAVAALWQDAHKGWRFHRALLRRYAVEGKDPSDPSVIADAAREAKLDLAKLREDLADKEAVHASMMRAHEQAPPAHAGFYNVVVWDGGDRRVTLDYAFEPAIVEGAIDYLSGGKLHKAAPTDVMAYLREHGLAPLLEIRRAFALTEHEARARLEQLEKKGDATRVTLAGAPHWGPA